MRSSDDLSPDRGTGSAKPPIWAGLWYFPVVVLSAGILAPIPFIHAAVRLRRTSVRILAGMYTLASVAMVYVMSAAPSSDSPAPPDETLATILGFLAMTTVIAGCVQLGWLRGEVYGFRSRALPARVPPPAEPAIAAALSARARRRQARELAERDPLLARELRVGRPDLARDYDDGGLVELNTAPASSIAEICDLTMEDAEKIVSGRGGGAYGNVDEVLVLVDLPIASWPTIRDRGIVIG